MKRVLLPLLLVVALVAVAVAGYWLKRPAEAIAVSCVDPLAGCAFIHRSAPARVRFLAQPVALEAFDLSVTAVNAQKIHAELQMVGMDMGFNRYALRRGEPGEFAARITLPICVSGRRDWMLYLDIDGMRYALPFRTR
ncbi:MAG: hypothetical protein Q7T90_03230 [Thiobacillus sp.]|nr:hypothetical protein [Thiobacillus sp.]